MRWRCIILPVEVILQLEIPRVLLVVLLVDFTGFSAAQGEIEVHGFFCGAGADIELIGFPDSSDICRLLTGTYEEHEDALHSLPARWGPGS